MLPSEDQILSLIRTGDTFKYAVVGFTAIEAAIDVLIIESLHTNHRLEVKRLSIDLKVDLLIALGTLHKESKGLLLKLSKARNYYAHEFAGTKDYCASNELLSCFSKYHFEIAKDHLNSITTFNDALRISFVTAYHDVVACIDRLRELRKQRDEFMLHVEALLSVDNNRAPSLVPPEIAAKAKEELDKAIDKRKREIVSNRLSNK